MLLAEALTVKESVAVLVLLAEALTVKESVAVLVGSLDAALSFSVVLELLAFLLPLRAAGRIFIISPLI